ncbi:hypothetical protein [Oceanirhabdus sp. W0125-5]|uniref:hypothetical protein n=1 Tax=Oceanirhabdus sp. W0125-5 TaxID=2999116 RepID=UPI0022F31BE4|nr:hypothetical protein [Oceanirhabdus sp. W0125-5]WBW95564.1 hypothetical protein OW730_17950 [Oceanirhabdus sp. W0125-5]
MNNIDKRDRLKENPFSYKITKANKTFIFFDNRRIKILSEKETEKFISKINNKDEFQIQMILAKLTGNFKHGNER